MTSLHIRIIEQTTAAQHAALRGEYGASARLLQEIAQAVRLEAMERGVMFTAKSGFSVVESALRAAQ